MSTPWQRRGETESLSSACARYGVNEDDFLKAGYETKFRSFFGNGYLIAQVEDVKAFKAKVEEEKKAKEQALIAKYGKEGLAKMRQEAKEAIKAAAKAKILLGTIVVLLRESASLFPTTGKPVPIKHGKIGKTAAKKEWYLNENDMDSLKPAEIIGQRKNYSILDIIRCAHSKHSATELIKKLGDSKEKKKQYLSCLRGYVDNELDGMEATAAAKLIKDAKNELENTKKKIESDAEAEQGMTRAKHAESVEELNTREEKLKKALKETQDQQKDAPGKLKRTLGKADTLTKEKLAEKEKMLHSLDALYGSRCGGDDDDDIIAKENASPKKKQKMKA